MSLGIAWLDADGGLHRGERVEQLRDKERDLLLYLLEASPRVVPREELLREVWGYHPHTASRTVDTTVKRLRAKLEIDPAQPKVLLTVRGEGYQLLPPAPPTPDLPQGRCVGREREIDRAEGALASGRPIALLGGPGMGKSMLLAEIGRRAARHGRRVVLVETNGLPLDLAMLGDALGLQQVTLEMVTVSLAEPLLTLLIDDLERSDIDLSILPAATVIVALRGEDPRWETVRLRPLDATSGRHLLEACRAKHDLPPLSAEQAEQWVKQLEGIPLALSLASSWVEGEAIIDVWAEPLRRSIAGACERLSAQERDLLTELATAPLCLERSLVYALSDRTPAQTDALIAALLRRSLAVSSAEGIRLFDPVRQHAKPQGERAALLRGRLVHSIAARSAQAVNRDDLHTVRSLREAIAWALPNAAGEDLLGLLRSTVFVSRLCGPCHGLYDHLTRIGQHHTGRFERAVSGWARVSAAEIEGRTDEICAIGRGVVDDLLAIDQSALAAIVLLKMAQVADQQDQINDVVRLLEEARLAALREGSQLVATSCDLLLEVARVRLGAPIDRGAFARLSDRFITLDNGGNAGSPYWYLGGLMLERGPLDEAILWLREGLALSLRYTGDHVQLAHLRSHIAQGLLAQGDLAGAEEEITSCSFEEAPERSRADQLLVRGALLILRGEPEAGRALLLRSALQDERSRRQNGNAALLMAATDDPQSQLPDDQSLRAIAIAIRNLSTAR